MMDIASSTVEGAPRSQRAKNALSSTKIGKKLSRLYDSFSFSKIARLTSPKRVLKLIQCKTNNE
jgi:hypothetical protein